MLTALPSPLISPRPFCFGARRMILIVDDHRDSRDVLARLFSLDGYETRTAPDGRAALNFLESNAPQLIILDYSMPELDGLAVIQFVRHDPRYAAIPIIMFSANEGHLRHAALDAGANAYVVKASMDWIRLREEVTRLIGPGKPAPLNTGHNSQPRKQNLG